MKNRDSTVKWSALCSNSPISRIKTVWVISITKWIRAAKIPIVGLRKTIDNTTNKPSIVINNSNSQSQEQSQNIDFLIKSIEDAFTISQLKELRQIVNEENENLEKAKPKLMEKIKSFGSNLTRPLPYWRELSKNISFATLVTRYAKSISVSISPIL